MYCPLPKDTIDLIFRLKDAIESSDKNQAQELASELAKLSLSAKLEIQVEQCDQREPFGEQWFKVQVQVEDRECSDASFSLDVCERDRIQDLKAKVLAKYHIPVEVQKWIVNKKIPKDDDTLWECHVHEPCTLYLYLLQASAARLIPRVCASTRLNVFSDRDEIVDQTTNVPIESQSEEAGRTLSGEISSTVPKMLLEDRSLEECQDSINLDASRKSFCVKVENECQETEEGTQDASRKSFSLKVENGCQETEEGTQAEASETEWACNVCTFKNPSRQVMCDMCDSSRQSVPFDIPERIRLHPNFNETMKDVRVGTRVLWPSSLGIQRGTVRWVGVLPDVEGSDITVGIDCDMPVGFGDGMYKNQRLFRTRPGHALLHPLINLSKE